MPKSAPATVAATPMSFIRGMLVAYEKYGVDPWKALRSAGIEARSVRAKHALITAGQLEAFCESAMRQLDDEGLGWFSRRLPWGTYGMLCRASISSPDLGVALMRWCRHHRLIVDDVVLTLVVRGRIAHLAISEQRALDPRTRELCLLTLLRYVHGFACWAIDSCLPVHCVVFAHLPPSHHEAYRLMFPGPIYFDAETTGFSFDAEYLALPLRRDEAALQRMLRRALPLTVRQYRHDRLIVERARRLLSTRQTAETLAQALNTSVRTLHRQLRNEGTSLQALKDEVRRDAAIHLLTRTQRSIKQVAIAVSFENEKSFSRAFRQWTGYSPQAFRRRLVGHCE